MKPVFLCNPKKNKKCTAHCRPGVIMCNECRCTTKPLYADWKKMFKFWWNKWFHHDIRFRCRHLCCLCEFKHEYYIDCMMDISRADRNNFIGSRIFDMKTAIKKYQLVPKEESNNEGTTED